MNALILLNDEIRRGNTKGSVDFQNMEALMSAAREIERQQNIISIYEQLWGKLPQDLHNLIREKVDSRNANDGISFMKTKGRIEECVNDLRRKN